MQPTAQAQQLISILLKAEQKGLAAEDYDGQRWGDRLAKLKPTSVQPSEADAVRFDAALTVCVMRYISDLHIGKVNPKHFDFGLDVESKKYDLPDFLKADVVDSSDVAGALAKVEPPYPGYQRTIQALHSYLEFVKEYDWNQLPAIQKTIAPGDSYSGVPQLSKLLRLVGDLSADANVPPMERSIKLHWWTQSGVFSAGMAEPRMDESPRKAWPTSMFLSQIEYARCNLLSNVGGGCPLTSTRPPSSRTSPNFVSALTMKNTRSCCQ